MADAARRPCGRAWYRRPPVWIVAVLLLILAGAGVVALTSGPAPIAYGAFLDQVDAGNVAGVVFEGTRIEGSFKLPVAGPGGAPATAFRSDAPAFGDPGLVAALRREHVTIGIGAPAWLGAGTLTILGILGAVLVAKPMLLLVAGAFVVGLVRLARGGTMDIRAILSVMPMFASLARRDVRQEAAGPSAAPDPGPQDPARRPAKPWWSRPLAWILGAALLGVLAFGVVSATRRPATISYGTFLDELDAGHVASVTFSGTAIEGKLRPRVAAVAGAASGAGGFRSQVPDVGDASLLPELRRQQVAIAVAASSGWLAWLGRLPWPMVALGVVIVVAWLVNRARGRDPRAGAAMPAHPMQAMFGLLGGMSSAGHGEASSRQDEASRQGGGTTKD